MVNGILFYSNVFIDLMGLIIIQEEKLLGSINKKIEHTNPQEHIQSLIWILSTPSTSLSRVQWTVKDLQDYKYGLDYTCK